MFLLIILTVFYNLYNKLIVSRNVLVVEAKAFRLFFNVNALAVFSDVLCSAVCTGNEDRRSLFLFMEPLKYNQSLVRGISFMVSSKLSSD